MSCRDVRVSEGMIMSKIVVPANLRQVMTPSTRAFVDQYPISTWMGVAFASFSVLGPVFGPHVDFNGWRFLVLPIICPFLVLPYFRFLPPNHYRSWIARESGRYELDKRNSDAARWVSLLHTRAAHAALWRIAVKIGSVGFTIMILAMVVTSYAGLLNWSVRLTGDWFWQGLLGSAIGSFVAVGSEFFHWVVVSWVGNEKAPVHNQQKLA